MARAKKEAALTPEERLQAALVPDWEWPYKLPENWCWTTVGTICDGFQYGYTEKATFEKIGPHFIRITDIGDGIINDSGAPYCKIDSDSFIKYKINKDDILIARMGSVGENGLATHNIDGVFASYLIRIVPRSNAKYVCNFLQTNLYWGQISEKAQGTTRLNVNANVLKNLIIPLAPLAEQQRIVDRIESLFAKLNEAKEKAQAVLDSFETRKAAILHKAFTGELTAKWREERGVGMESWEKRRINELARPRAGYAFDSKEFSNTGYQVVRMGNLYGETLDLFRKPVFISEDDVDDSILNRALIKDGDILITLTGTKYKRDYGYAVCVSSPNKLLVNQRILCLTPFACVERNYLLYYLKSNLFRDVFFSCETGGVNQGNVSSKFVEDIEIPIPTFDEQLEITTVLDRTLAHEQQAKEAAEAVLDQIDLMKKSILARAFRGELGTNDPSEESAVELLKRTIL